MKKLKKKKKKPISTKPSIQDLTEFWVSTSTYPGSLIWKKKKK